jgi:hypothetical protein
MLTFFREGGVIMYPLVLVTLVVAVLAVRAWLRLRSGEVSQATLGTGIDAVLFWGAYAAVLGVLGTLVGISQAAAAISQAAEVSPPIVWMGIRIALSTTIYGLLVFAIALLLWFGLRHGHRRRLAAAG